MKSKDAIELDDVHELVKTMYEECRIDYDAFDERSTHEDVEVVLDKEDSFRLSFNLTKICNQT